MAIARGYVRQLTVQPVNARLAERELWKLLLEHRLYINNVGNVGVAAAR